MSMSTLVRIMDEWNKASVLPWRDAPASPLLALPPTAAELRTLRAKAAAWDFLAAYGDPDPVPGATLADYLDAAYAYACDVTGVDLSREDTP